MTRQWMALGCLVTMLAGCESATARKATVEVTPDVAEAYSADAPGLVTVDFDGWTYGIGALCGQSIEPLEVDIFTMFSCIPEQRDTQIRAWVSPIDERYDAAKLCALDRDDEGLINWGEAVLPVEEDTDSDTDTDTDTDTDSAPDAAKLASHPDSTWPQGATDARWRRAGDPCGGSLEGDVLVSMPAR